MEIFDDPARSQTLALILGGLGGSLVAVAIAFELTALVIIGALVLAASGAVWAIRGVKEDQVAEANAAMGDDSQK